MGASKSKKDLAKTVKHHTEFCWWTLHKYVATACSLAPALLHTLLHAMPYTAALALTHLPCHVP